MHALKVSGSTADIAAFILDLGREGWIVSFGLRPLYVAAEIRRCPFNTTLGGFQSWCGRFEKTKMSCLLPQPGIDWPRFGRPFSSCSTECVRIRTSPFDAYQPSVHAGGLKKFVGSPWYSYVRTSEVPNKNWPHIVPSAWRCRQLFPPFVYTPYSPLQLIHLTPGHLILYLKLR